MKNAAKVFNRWFFAWLGIATVLVIIMLIIGGSNMKAVKMLAGFTMAALMVLPVRDWAYRLIVWAIDFVSSNNTDFKDWINPKATQNTLLDPTKREENVAFYRSLKVGVGIVTTCLALLFLIFRGVSFNIIYGFLHTWEFIFRGKIGFVSLLFYILLTAGWTVAVLWLGYQILKGNFLDDNGNIKWSEHGWKIIAMSIGLYAKILISGLLLKYTADMILASMLAWTAIVGVPLLFWAIVNVIARFANQNQNPNP